VLSGEATNTNFIIFGLTRSGLVYPIYRTQGEQANHYTTDEVYTIARPYTISEILHNENNRGEPKKKTIKFAGKINAHHTTT
jgi:hypothetical protein